MHAAVQISFSILIQLGMTCLENSDTHNEQVSYLNSSHQNNPQRCTHSSLDPDILQLRLSSQEIL